MGPQDQKWRSMYYDTASKQQQDPQKTLNIKQRFEDHLSHLAETSNMQSPGFGGAEQFRDKKRQNYFLKNYSTPKKNNFFSLPFLN